MVKESTIRRFDELNVIGMYKDQKLGVSTICKLLKIGKPQLRQYLQIKGVEMIHNRRNPAPIGGVFGDWTVMSEEAKYGFELGLSDNKIHWKVQCKCGEVCWRESNSLKIGTSKRCRKCFSKKYRTLIGQIDVSWCLEAKYKKLKEAAMRRKKVSKLEFTVTLEDIKELYYTNPKCALSGIDLTWDVTKTINEQNLSIDRIDSDKGYTKDNIQLVDKRINMMKGVLSDKEFIELCTKVAEYNKLN